MDENDYYMMGIKEPDYVILFMYNYGITERRGNNQLYFFSYNIFENSHQIPLTWGLF